jgi:hypothetical protein
MKAVLYEIHEITSAGLRVLDPPADLAVHAAARQACEADTGSGTARLAPA